MYCMKIGGRSLREEKLSPLRMLLLEDDKREKLEKKKKERKRKTEKRGVGTRFKIY